MGTTPDNMNTMQNIGIGASIVVATLAFIAGLVGALRALLHLGVWINALAENTKATVKLTDQLTDISGKVTHLSDRVDALERRIEVH